MKIWIDADAAPREIKEVIFRAARRLDLETVLVANHTHAIPPNTKTVSAITVPGTANAADRYIEQNANAGDIVITADIPLAAALVGNGVLVIDPRGEEYHADNIAAKLSMRNFMDTLRGAGQISGGAAPLTSQNKKLFAAAFDRLVARRSKNE